MMANPSPYSRLNATNLMATFGSTSLTLDSTPVQYPSIMAIPILYQCQEFSRNLDKLGLMHRACEK